MTPRTRGCRLGGALQPALPRSLVAPSCPRVRRPWQACGPWWRLGRESHCFKPSVPTQLPNPLSTRCCRGGQPPTDGRSRLAGTSAYTACRAVALGLCAMLLGVLGQVDVSARPKWLDQAPRSSRDNAPPPSWTLWASIGHLQAARVPRRPDPMGQRRGQAPGPVSLSQDLSAGACQLCRRSPSWGARVSGASKPKSPLAVVGAGRSHLDRSVWGPCARPSICARVDCGSRLDCWGHRGQGRRGDAAPRLHLAGCLRV